MAKMVPMFSTLDEALKNVDEFKEIYNHDPQAKNLIEYAKKLEGVSRHSSTHACGVLITPKPLDQFVPLQYSTTDNETLVSQYSLHPIEDLGLLKMDFLGLKNLTSIETTLEIIEKTEHKKINIDKIPLDDPKTFELFKKGQTTGVFQLESSGMRRYLVSLDPSTIEDIIVMISLYRPGPMELIPDYIARKKGLKTITYLHPQLKPILEKTYGIAVYQEQVMQIARKLAGFSYSEADVLRKAVGKKIKKLLDEQEGKMIEGMIKNGVNEKNAKQIWEYILPFARYGFNRAHAASYAMISYQTAYLKANYPTQFMAALLTADQGNTDRIALEIVETEKMNIEVTPPDINESYTIFTMVVTQETKQKARIRFGLGAIKNVGEHITKIIIHERKTNGLFKNLTDFLSRIQNKDLNKKSLESLIKSGALDKFGERNQLLFNIDKLLKFTKRQDPSNKQSDLFSKSGINSTLTLNLEETKSATKQQRLTWEKELLGIYLSEHPLDEVKHLLPHDITFITKLNNLPDTKLVKIAGVIQKIKKVITRKGDPMLFATLEDTTGTVEILVFPKVLEKSKEMWLEDKLVLITGKISEKDSEPKILCEAVADLKIEEMKNKMLNINIPKNTDKEVINELKRLLGESKGTMIVFLNLYTSQNIKKVKLKQGINYTNELNNKLTSLLGDDNIRLS